MAWRGGAILTTDEATFLHTERERWVRCIVLSSAVPHGKSPCYRTTCIALISSKTVLSARFMALRRHRNTSCLSDRWIPNLRYSAGNGIRKLTPYSPICFIRRLYVILKLRRYTNRRRAGSIGHRAKRVGKFLYL
ncbi:hypothetical protein FVEG_15543 [Fusarium verticillioides 7600]|uniref:Uncharacterized protein n=1 Tax=Gibberella moniliformis (strain M3125 / FGSC 7600) TaxID=334819 RepID=W7LXA7_GIBM7|nr:hypothetical protein FVEG_15543 [Fusarium verticillioides 7600]XP_018749408.1 hypothetical protein FVEG_15543 [Fusarium verticillioides 7600]EWG43216.1 hypothetical protein FVEG_15543 [Fusarium verticillioides 7600]EWG43217.1 hypothetical protein FVEG_15543 [Fusarium verticillioides 7600]